MRPARQCRCQKASCAAPAGRPTPKVGNAARTAVSTRCEPARTARSASTCSESFRSSSSARERRPSGDVLRVLTPDRNNNRSSSASVAAMGVRNGLRVFNVFRKAARQNRSVPHNSRRRRKPRASAPEDVAGAVAVVERNRHRLSRNKRGLRASRVRHVRPKRHRSLRAKAQPRAPRAMAPNAGDVFGDGGVAAGAGRRAGRRRLSVPALTRLPFALLRVSCLPLTASGATPA
jgi:hypothetical protein